MAVMPSRPACSREIGAVGRSRDGATPARTSRSRPVAATWSSMRTRSRARRSSAAPCGGEEVVGERQVLPVDACEPAGETDSEPLKRREVDVAMIIASDELQSALVAGADRISDFVDGRCKRIDPVEPPPDVHPPVSARHAVVTTDGQDDLATGAGEFVGDLHPCRGRPHDEHSPVRQLIRGTVDVRGDLRDRRIEALRDARHAWPVAPSGGDHDTACGPRRL